jgi:hypothetical protein
MTKNIFRVIRDPETKTIYVNENHLKPVIKNQLLKGMLDIYNIGLYSLRANSRLTINNFKDRGYKVIFIHNDEKPVLILYNK